MGGAIVTDLVLFSSFCKNSIFFCCPGNDQTLVCIELTQNPTTPINWKTRKFEQFFVPLRKTTVQINRYIVQNGRC